MGGAGAIIETFAALLFAHVLADFVFQTGRIARAKQARHAGALALHIAIVLALAIAAPGAWHPVLAALAAAHLVIDLAKTFAPQDRLWPFLADQAAHLATLAAAAAFAPDLWQTGVWMTGAWAPPYWVPGVMAAVAGLVAATRAGGYAVGLLIGPLATDDLPKGLANGGALIGVLERGLIFLFIFAGQPMGIGFLVAAKSVLRFEATAGDQRASEYVIIGTLASFGWAMAVAWAALALVAALPGIGIFAATP
mgnify:FL=1